METQQDIITTPTLKTTLDESGITLQQLLSLTAPVFDPFGILKPFTVRLRLLQSLTRREKCHGINEFLKHSVAT